MSVPLRILRASGRRAWLKTLRRPVPLTFSFVQPVIWMAVFGFLFQRFALGEEWAGFAYVDFLVPGVCAMTVLFGASQAGITLVRDLQTGFLRRMLRAAVRPGWMLGGKLLADVSRLLAQALGVALVGVAVGAHLTPSASALLVAVAGLAFFALGYASLSCWIALRTGAPESMGAFVHLVNMPVLFTSTALVPTRQMPPWLQSIATVNPLTAVADGLRHSLLLPSSTGAWGATVSLSVPAALFFWLARSALLRVGRTDLTAP